MTKHPKTMLTKDEQARAELVTKVGMALYDADWKQPLADALGVSRQTIHNWEKGRVGEQRAPGRAPARVPEILPKHGRRPEETVEERLLAIVRAKGAKLAEIEAEIEQHLGR